MKIAILGGGHGCYAAAADLSEQGHEVIFWRRDASALAPLIASRSIMLKDATGTRDVPIAGATADISTAVRDAELVLIPSPATAQDDIAASSPASARRPGRVLPPHVRQLRDGADRVRRGNTPARLAETGTCRISPASMRARDQRHGARSAPADRVYPARDADRTIDVIRAPTQVSLCGDARRAR